MEDWAEIRRLHRSEGMPIKAIARVMGCSRNTVRAALASDGPPKYRPPPASGAAPFDEPGLRQPVDRRVERAVADRTAVTGQMRDAAAQLVTGHGAFGEEAE